MALYWIGYDLDKPGQDYTDLIRRLKQLGASRILKSDWLLRSNTLSAEQIRDDLQHYIDANDRILVSEQKNHAAWQNLMISDVAVKKLFSDYAS
jgi:hypothetical protein